MPNNMIILKQQKSQWLLALAVSSLKRWDFKPFKTFLKVSTEDENAWYSDYKIGLNIVNFLKT